MNVDRIDLRRYFNLKKKKKKKQIKLKTEFKINSWLKKKKAETLLLNLSKVELQHKKIIMTFIF